MSLGADISRYIGHFREQLPNIAAIDPLTKEPDSGYPLGKNQEYACVYDWEDRPG
jgi:hypothetical protein